MKERKVKKSTLSGPNDIGLRRNFVKEYGQKVVSRFCVNQRAGTPFLQDRRSENERGGWRLACIELRKMVNHASIGKGSLYG